MISWFKNKEEKKGRKKTIEERNREASVKVQESFKELEEALKALTEEKDVIR